MPARIPQLLAAILLAAAVHHAAAAEPRTGTLSGVIKYDGKPPKRRLLSKKGNPKVPAFCRRFDIPDESLLVDAKSRGVANVVIYLRRKPKGYKSAAPKKPLEFTIDKCRYVRRVQIARVGQTVQIENDDPVAHCFHAYTFAGNGSCFLVGGAAAQDMKYDAAERNPVRIGDNIYSVMTAWQVVLDHPFAAVTDKNGRFTIEGLPPGKYRFAIWHEKAGFLDRRYDVTIRPGETTKFSLAYEPNRFDGK